MMSSDTYCGSNVGVLSNPKLSLESEMARKVTDVVQFSLRLREALRLRLEGAAKKRAVTVNYEITDRLQRSFEAESLRDLDRITHDMQITWARYGDAILKLDVQRDLIRSVETLLDRIGPAIRNASDADKKIMESAVAGVRTVIDVAKKSGAA
jgi:hypothetical protein